MNNPAKVGFLHLDPQESGGGLFQSAARSSAAVALAKTLRYGFVFLVQIVLVNLLDPADFGLVRYVTIITGLLNLLNEAGLNTAIVQKKRLQADDLGPVFTACLLFSMALYLAVWALSTPLSHFLGEARLRPMLITAAAVVPLGAASVIQRALLQRRLQFGRLSVIELAGGIAGASGSLVLAIMGFGAWSLVWGTVIYSALSTALCAVLAPRILPSARGMWRTAPIFFFGLGIVVQRLLDFASGNIDYLVVGKAFGATTLGVYGIAYDIVTLPQTALGVVLYVVAMSAFARFQDDNARLESAFLNMTLVVAVAATPLLVLSGVMAGDLVSALTILRPSDKWAAAAQYLRVLAPVGLLYSYSSYPGAVWIAKGRIDVQVGWAAAMCASVAAAVLIGACFGPLGVCWALFLRAALLFPLSLLVSKAVAGFSPRRYVATLWPAFACGAAAAAAAWLTTAALPARSAPQHAARLAAGAAAALLAYTGLLYFLFRSRWEQMAAFARSFSRRSVPHA